MKNFFTVKRNPALFPHTHLFLDGIHNEYPVKSGWRISRVVVVDQTTALSVSDSPTFYNNASASVTITLAQPHKYTMETG